MQVREAREGNVWGGVACVMGYKMVRDNHRHLLEGTVSGKWRTSPDPVSALVKKIGEEYSELAEDRSPGELYDMQDALEELIRLMDPTGKYLDEHKAKVEIAGRFRQHLEWHSLPQGDVTWPQYVNGETRD